MKRIFLALVLGCFLGGRADAAPAITTYTGTIAEGDTITINGSGFGVNNRKFTFLSAMDGGALAVAPNRTIVDTLENTHPLGLGWQTGSSTWASNPAVCSNGARTSTVKARTGRTTSLRQRINHTNTACAGNPRGGFGWAPFRANADVAKSAWASDTTYHSGIVYASWWSYDDVVDPSPPTSDGQTQVKYVVVGSLASGIGDILYRAANCGGMYYSKQYGIGTGLPLVKSSREIYCIKNNPPCSCRLTGGQPCPPPLGTCDGQAITTSLNLVPCTAQGCATGQMFNWQKQMPTKQWVHSELFVKANKSSTSGEVEATGQYVETCMTEDGAKTQLVNMQNIITHAWDWEPYATSGYPTCNGLQGNIPHWGQFTVFSYIGYSVFKNYEEWFDDIYVQFGTQARVVLGNAATYAACTRIELQPPGYWKSDGTQIKIALNYGGFSTTDPRYLYVIDGAGIVSAPKKVEAYTVRTTLPATVASGTPFWANFRVESAQAWRAAAFKVYYDSTRVLPVRYDFTGAGNKGCMGDFDDVVTRQAKAGTKLADSDAWILYDKDVADTTDVLVGRIQFFPFATGAAEITTNDVNAISHELGTGGVNQACIDPFSALGQANGGALIFTDAAGSAVVRPDDAAWVTIADTISVTGVASDRCTGNWDNHPPKEGGFSPAGAFCSPLAVVFTAADSTIAGADTLVVTMSVWADSVKSIEGYIEYLPVCDEFPATLANIPLSYVLETSNFNQLTLTWDADVTFPGPISPRCYEESALNQQFHNGKLAYFKLYRSDGALVSIAGPAITMRFTQTAECGVSGGSFQIGLPCGDLGKTYVDPKSVGITFDYGNTQINKGSTLLYERAKYSKGKILEFKGLWLNEKILFVSNLDLYTVHD
jgi:hypothetical protein